MKKEILTWPFCQVMTTHCRALLTYSLILLGTWVILLGNQADAMIQWKFLEHFISI